MSPNLAAAVPNQPATPDLVGPLVIAILLLFLAVLGIWAFVGAESIRNARWRAIRRARGLRPSATGQMFGSWVGMLTGRGLQPATALTPGPRVAESGGYWLVADASHLIAVPGSLHRIHVVYTPDYTAEAFAPAAVRAVLRARETWCDPGVVPSDLRVNRFPHSRTLMEIPAQAGESLAGGPVSWDLGFAVPGTVPPTCGRIETLACDWLLAISVDRPNMPVAILEQPIIMAQPRDRLMAGGEQSLWSRFEEASGVSGALTVDFRVRPVPLDLAGPATAELLVSNGGPLIRAREVRLELLVQATGQDAASDGWVIWQASKAIVELRAGQTRLPFEIPAVNLPCPDADLPHGQLRGKLRLVVDRAYLPDLAVERDLCLCLDKPAARR
jgi:hypothetical protein